MRGAVSKSLEPTEEQERRLRQMIEGFGSASPLYDAGVTWNLIRDMVLEAAEAECEAVIWANRDANEYAVATGAAMCMTAIRGLKGTP